MKKSKSRTQSLLARKANSNRRLFLESLESRICLAADPAFLPGEVLIQFAADATQQDRVETRGLVKAQLKQQLHTATMKAHGVGVIDRVQLPENVPVHAAINMFKNNPRVVIAEPNYILTTSAISNDPGYTGGSLWGMESDDSPITVGPNGTTNIYGSQAEEAWNDGNLGSSSVLVGIIDEGFDYTHPDLADNSWANPAELNGLPGVDDDGNGYVDDIRGWDFYNNDNSSYDGTGDDHGTHVAGTIGGKGGNGIGVAGVSWNVSMIPAKFLGTNGGSTAGAIAAVDYITDLKTRHNLDIVATNNSWGGGGFSSLLEAAIIRGANEDILFIASAGNNNTNVDSTSYYPSNYSTLNPQGSGNSPASYDAVISVASITSSGARSSFSNYGVNNVDIAAPGSSIYSTLPNNSYGTYSGTSMAAPHVAGAAALFASKSSPGALTRGEEIRNALLQTAVPTSSVNGLVATGGRLDVNAALALANPPGLDVGIYATSLSEQAEGNLGTKSFTFEIRLDQPATDPSPITVEYEIDLVGGATADDFSFGPGGGIGSVTFNDPTNPNALVQTISFEVVGDTEVETDESFDVVIPVAPSNAGLWNDRATGTIVADDARIDGVVWNDANGNGVQDGTEAGRGGVTVYVDANENANLDAGEISAITAADGQYQLAVSPGSHRVRLQLTGSDQQTHPFPQSGSLDPDSYADGTILNGELEPAVSLSAVGSSVTNANVTAQTQTYSSTGSKVFASTWNGGIWNTGDAEFRVDFSNPVNIVSLDGISDDSSDYVHMRAFSDTGILLQEYVSGNLGTGVVETMTITRAGSDISYILASGRDGQFAWLDNLSYSSDSIPISVGSNVSSGHNFGVFNIGGSPSASDDVTSTLEDVPVSIPVLKNDTDPDDDPLTVTGTSGVDNGTVAISGNVITFTPEENFNGVEEFEYQISDGKGGVSSANVTVTVNAVNDLPQVEDDSYSVAEGGSLTINAPGVLGNDTDVDGDALTASMVSDVTKGTLTLNPDGSFTYNPDVDFFGVDTFTYRANDPSPSVEVATVTITVVEQNDPPVANDDSYTVSEDGLLQVALPGLLGNDNDNEDNPLTAAVVTEPTDGLLTLNADGSFEYEPDADFSGSDSFTYVANDGNSDSDIATVAITVTAINDNPVASDDSATTDQNTAVTIDVLVNDTDADGDSLTITNFTQGNGGSVTGNLDGTLTYTPNAGFLGNDQFNYSISDGQGGSSTAVVQVAVTGGSYTYRDVASATANSFGTSDNNFSATHWLDGSSQTVTEESYQRNSRSRLEQTWSFDVTGGDLGVNFNATVGHNSAVETFEFEYDAGAGWTTMFTLNTTDVSPYSYQLPNSVSGIVQVRVTDTNRSKNERSLDSVQVDEMFFVSERSNPLPPRISIESTDPNASEAGPDPGEFVISLVDGIAQATDINVNYQVSGLAQSNDYIEILSGSVTIKAGDLSATIAITPFNDSEQEQTEDVTLTLLDSSSYVLTAANESSVFISDDDTTEFFAESENSIYGSTNADYTKTFADDGDAQVLTEERYSGGNKKSRLEHRWNFDLSGLSTVEFVLDAEHLSPSDRDNFVFQYSVNGGASWDDLLNVTPSTNPMQTASVNLPAGTRQVIVRVIDTDNSNDRSSASLSIDQMMFRLPSGSNAATDGFFALFGNDDDDDE